MPHTILLRLPATGQEDTEWLTIDDAGNPATARQRGPLSLAAAVGRSAKVVVTAPAAQILLAEPELPPGSGVRLARAVPFALEEQLTEDIDHLFFALGKRRAGGGTPVAVLSRSVLEGWLSDLSAAGIAPAAIYADMSLLPQNPGQSVLWLEQGRLSVRRPGKLPFAVELTPVTEAMIVAGVIADPLAAGGGSHTMESAVLYVTREDWAIVQDEIETLAERFASLKIQLLPDGPLPWLARGLEGTDAVNLLQGEFAPATTGIGWRKWRTAGALAAGLLAVHVAADAVQLRQAKHESAALDAQIAQVFSSSMPAVEMKDARRQMQTRLDRIRHSGPGPQHFLRTLQALSEAMSQGPNTTIDSMSYRQDLLEMRVTAPSLAALSQLSQRVGKQGLAAEIQSSTPVGSGVEAHVQVRPAGAPKARP
ncbi:MAG: ral secretion pathway protein [Gammaproteobacteria bacterium]|jgi:general secretion pathway protein L|nr:ral secretion pathway protein [Gammaproteobacteria bacterium]